MDINGNSKDAGKDFDLRQKYGIWLMNIVRNTVIKYDSYSSQHKTINL